MPASEITVFTIKQWAEMRGVSKSTARRLIRDGRLKVTRLSERRLCIRSDHDKEFLDNGWVRYGHSNTRRHAQVRS